MAAADCTSEADQLNDNSRVGYYVDDDGCGWVDVTVSLSVEGKTVTTCATRIALPTNADDNPWGRRGNQWNP